MAENGGQSKDMIFRAMWNNMLPVIREQGGEIFGRIAGAAATPMLGEEKGETVSRVVDSTFQVGLSVSANVRDFTVVAKDGRRRMGALLDDVAPYLEDEFGKSSRGKLMRSSNEVINHERSRLMGHTKYGVFKAASGLTDKLPEMYGVMDKKRAQVQAGTLPEAAEGDVRGKLDEGLAKVASSGVFDEQNRKMIDAAIRTGAPAIQEYIEAEGVERFGKLSAFELIKDLAEQAQSGDGRVDIVMHKGTGEQLSLNEYVLEVFKQHQVDTDGAPLNERFRFMPEMEDACDRIANEIKDNLLDPMALVSLVGSRSVLDDRLRVATPEKIDSELNRMWRVIEKAQDVDTQEFISETAFATPEDFRATLDELPKDEKAFFASLFPDAVLKDMGGLKSDEIDKLKEQGADEFVGQMTQAIETLGTMGEKELQRYGLTAKEGKLMRKLSDAIDDMGAEKVVAGLQGRAREEVTEAVRNGRGYWQDRVKTAAIQSREAEEAVDEYVEAGKDDASDEKKGRFASMVRGDDDKSEQRAR